MTRTEPVVEPKGRYTVCEAARLMDCTRKTLWKYAEYFRVVPGINRVNGRAVFTGEQLLRIWRCAI